MVDTRRTDEREFLTHKFDAYIASNTQGGKLHTL